MTVERVVHKPTVAYAVVWDDTDAARDALTELGYLADNETFDYADERRGGPRTLLIPTPKGTKPALPGDTILLGELGEWWPIEPDARHRYYNNEQLS